MSDSENDLEHFCSLVADSHSDQPIAEIYNEEHEPLLAVRPGLLNNPQTSFSTARSNLMLERLQASSIALSPSLEIFLRTFSRVLSSLRVFTYRFGIYAREHPYLLAAQSVGICTLIISTTALPILGFSSAGPVVGSVAAGWQSSIGAVSAGSLFAFLQSAGMGGAAAGLFVGGGVVGGLIAAGATIMAAVGGWERVRDRFVGWAEKVRDGVGSFWGSLFRGW
ncbi:MAG: hypothetical protein Q9204_003711 [Flavoplaca sp. TL-2023a]